MYCKDCGKDEVVICADSYDCILGNKRIEPSQDDLIKEIATEFYYYWHNAPGTNTQQGFDDWWKINRARFISQ